MKNHYSFLLLLSLVCIIFLVTPTKTYAKSGSTVVLSDPTRPDLEKLKSNKTKANKNHKRSTAKLSLQQTFISQFKKIAIINGKPMRIGKKIQGAELIKIDSNHVVLRKRGKTFVLHLTFPPDIKEVNGN